MVFVEYRAVAGTKFTPETTLYLELRNVYGVRSAWSSLLLIC